MLAQKISKEYAIAVTTYLGFAVDRAADYGSALARWLATVQAPAGTFGRQALPMVWDYCEVALVENSGGGLPGAVEWIREVIEHCASVGDGNSNAATALKDARMPRDADHDIVLTDPPYYDSVDYAGLSDFFYVWLKRSLPEEAHPDLFHMPLTPKTEQVIMASERGDSAARDRYVSMMQDAFKALVLAAGRDPSSVGVVFAHTASEAWAVLIDGLIDAGLAPFASWPIDTERQNRTSSESRANLQTSVWMACHRREGRPTEAFLGDVLGEMRAVIKERLLYFWSQGIRGADFFISAIGPALSVYGRHFRVLRPDGHQVTPGEFINFVRHESTHVALEQVLSGMDLGLVDPLTQQYLAWVWSYSRTSLDSGEAIALCLATGADHREVTRPGAIAAETREASKKVVKLRTIRERGREDDQLGISTPARPAPLIDQLQRAAYLWSLNKMDDLSTYRQELGETRWNALRVLGQAVAECLPDGDEDRRLIFGLLASNVRVPAAPAVMSGSGPGFGSARQPLPGFEQAVSPQVPLPSPDEV